MVENGGIPYIHQHSVSTLKSLVSLVDHSSCGGSMVFFTFLCQCAHGIPEFFDFAAQLAEFIVASWSVRPWPSFWPGAALSAWTAF